MGKNTIQASTPTMFVVGAGYEDFMGRWSRLLAPQLLAFAGASDGERVLDVGAGTGALASAAADRLPSSDVVGVDPSAAFVEFARGQARTSRLRFEVGDAQALPFADAAFDQTTSLLVLNFVPDHTRAIAEMRRVTRPGGVVSACVWDYGAGMRMLRLFWDEAVALEPALEARDERHMKLSREGELGAALTAAGLVDVAEAPLTVERRFESFDHWWQPFLAGVGPAGACVAALADERRRALEQRLRRRIAGDHPGVAFTQSARAWCARGRVAGFG